ncbi:MAG: four helix bundle suffix domain-containing protein [Proteobacteria bacterium]|nr:four helix bundle suffix domain-containing protein [Pseudomonadota bacterium]
MTELIRKHGGYRRLKTFIGAEIVYDATVVFCNRFIDRRSRTHDQMVQAARSGRQNIAEGSVVSGTSKKIELKLTSIARASLEELLLDYEDFLRHRGLPQFDKEHPFSQEIRLLGYRSNRSYASYACYFEQTPPEIAANAAICLIHQTIFLLRRQLEVLAQRFETEGGFTERLYHARQKRNSFERWEK